MDKGTKNSGIPVFGEIVKLLDKQKINILAEEMGANRYTKRLDAYQHLIIMLYAQLGQFDSLREVELGFLCVGSCNPCNSGSKFKVQSIKCYNNNIPPNC